VFPQRDLIVVFTAWRALNDQVSTQDLVSRILPAASSQSCNVTPVEPQNGKQSGTLDKQQLSKQGPQNPEAYELYLKGRSYYDKRTLADLERQSPISIKP
jgi:hypothetical protein